MAPTTPSDAPAAPRQRARAGERDARHGARALALQGLYGWLVAGGEAEAIGRQLLTEEQAAKVDAALFRDLLGGTVAAAEELRADIAPLIDRPVSVLSPIEHGLLLMGAFELKYHPEVPYRVCINEAIELAKQFGGTDGYRYVNGVLDKLAPRLRGPEVAAARAAPEHG